LAASRHLVRRPERWIPWALLAAGGLGPAATIVYGVFRPAALSSIELKDVVGWTVVTLLGGGAGLVWVRLRERAQLRTSVAQKALREASTRVRSLVSRFQASVGTPLTMAQCRELIFELDGLKFEVGHMADVFEAADRVQVAECMRRTRSRLHALKRAVTGPDAFPSKGFQATPREAAAVVHAATEVHADMVRTELSLV